MVLHTQIRLQTPELASQVLNSIKIGEVVWLRSLTSTTSDFSLGPPRTPTDPIKGFMIKFNLHLTHLRKYPCWVQIRFSRRGCVSWPQDLNGLQMFWNSQGDPHDLPGGHIPNFSLVGGYTSKYPWSLLWVQIWSNAICWRKFASANFELKFCTHYPRPLWRTHTKFQLPRSPFGQVPLVPLFGFR